MKVAVSGVQVDEIALQTTTFIKWDGARIVLPNSYLFANMLTNMTRSKEKADIFKVVLLRIPLQTIIAPSWLRHRHCLHGGTCLSMNAAISGLGLFLRNREILT